MTISKTKLTAESEDKKMWKLVQHGIFDHGSTHLELTTMHR